MMWKTFIRKRSRFTAEIETDELNDTKMLLIKIVQVQYFH